MAEGEPKYAERSCAKCAHACIFDNGAGPGCVYFGNMPRATARKDMCGVEGVAWRPKRKVRPATIYELVIDLPWIIQE